MLDEKQALERAELLVSAAIDAGADAADALYSGGASTEISVRLGKLEDAGRSEGEEIGLRLFVGKRSASVSSSAMAPELLRDLAERAVAMAKAAPEDPYAGLAPEERLMKEPLPDLDLDDGAAADPDALREAALAAEDAARAVSGVTGSEGGGASVGRSVVALATSTGFGAAYARSSHSLSASVLAGESGARERDYAYRTARHAADLPDPAEIGRKAGERAAARLNPVDMTGGAMPVIFDPRVGGSLIGHLLGAMSGPAAARRATFLLDLMGERIFDSGIDILDDPHRPRGLASKSVDGEGLPTAPSKLVDAGRPTGWLLNVASARQLGLEPNGHATRGVGGSPGVGASNVHMAPGKDSPAALMAGIERGVYLTELIGQGVNAITGDYSRGAGGFLIENGEITRPVREITVAGNLKDMFAAMTPADDLEFTRALNVPTLRVDGMTVAA
ncbi:TldD/PmbA family protein [Novosphingopyxis sp. YJ-S2-01]|uniref:TldD/PmbA family protein n=1 Tax=Novosphingopyxis sp. YJ-S2-01 TaxID=2794021 RepID=UPI0018DD1EC8|nr:TldD/PmbA family protein [Novosphingopyxis sp. YJ-S2-01]MBH9536464.1 TldD/PmbA family protein [Novosphingopyxis sp. YJ-S2-01]